MKNIRQQRADERDKAAQIFTWCMVVAMHQEEGIGATRLERACNEMHEFQQRYRTKILTENRKSATDAMREDLKGICDFEVRLPQTKAPRNRREEQLRMAQNEGAEIAWLGYGGNNAPDLRLRQGTACPLEAGNAGQLPAIHRMGRAGR